MARLRRWLLGCICVAACPAQAADTGAPVIVEVQRCLDLGAMTETALDDQLMSRIGDPNQRTSETIHAELAGLQARYGTMDPHLLTTLIALGLQSRSAGDYAEAANAFDRALYVVRASAGLRSLEQLPVLNLLIEARMGMSDWHGVEVAYGLMHWLYRRNYAKNDPRQLHGLERLRQWHIDAYNKETGTSLIAHVDMADRLGLQAAAIRQACAANPVAAGLNSAAAVQSK